MTREGVLSEVVPEEPKGATSVGITVMVISHLPPVEERTECSRTEGVVSCPVLSSTAQLTASLLMYSARLGWVWPPSSSLSGMGEGGCHHRVRSRLGLAAIAKGEAGCGDGCCWARLGVTVTGQNE